MHTLIPAHVHHNTTSLLFGFPGSVIDFRLEGALTETPQSLTFALKKAHSLQGERYYESLMKTLCFHGHNLVNEYI